MKNLENLTIGDIVEIEYLESEEFKSTPSVVGYVSDLPNTAGYIGLRRENPLLPKEHYQFISNQIKYPVSNIKSITILKK